MDLWSHLHQKKVNQNLNLIPFIDLLSCLIIFLLFTSVWSQLSMIQLGSSVHAKRTHEEKAVSGNKDVNILFVINQRGYTVFVSKKRRFFPKTKGEYPTQKLFKFMSQLKKVYAQKKDIILSMSNHLPYQYLVQGMDIMLASGFSNISISSEEL